MNETCYLYVDKQNFVTYAMNRDNINNRYEPSWRRYLLKPENVKIFMKYYELRFHPRTLKNVVK